MSAVGVIPARYSASRLPGKPLAMIAGRPMIQHVWERASRARSLAKVCVATDDERIASACRGFGAEVHLTARHHASGTDRVGEVARNIEGDIIVNIQGDEPLVEGRVIDAAVAALSAQPPVELATVAHPIEAAAAVDRNRVKVRIGADGLAESFSREPLTPLAAGNTRGRNLQHVGIYAFRREFLERFIALPASAGERLHGLEQLRALENGHAIRVAVVEGWHSHPVDVAGDIDAVERILAARAQQRAPAIPSAASSR